MNLLSNHGTKLIGAAMTIVGAVAAADPATLGKYGPAHCNDRWGAADGPTWLSEQLNNAPGLPPPVTQ